MEPFTEKAVQIIQSIPEGHVMTYGQVAAAAGNRRGARQIVRILHSMSASRQLPWHRIINAKGGISAPADAQGKGNLQKERLLSEGVVFQADGTVDLEIYRWYPPDASME